MDDILAHAKDQTNMDRFAADHVSLNLRISITPGTSWGIVSQKRRKARGSNVESIVEKVGVKKTTPSIPNGPRTTPKKMDIRMFPYRKAMRMLMETVMMTRSGITFAVSTVAKLCGNSEPGLKQAGSKMLQYLFHKTE